MTTKEFKPKTGSHVARRERRSQLIQKADGPKALQGKNKNG